MKRTFLTLVIIILSMLSNVSIAQHGIVTILGDTLVGKAELCPGDYIKFSTDDKTLVFQTSYIHQAYQILTSKNNTSIWKPMQISPFLRYISVANQRDNRIDQKQDAIKNSDTIDTENHLNRLTKYQ